MKVFSQIAVIALSIAAFSFFVAPDAAGGPADPKQRQFDRYLADLSSQIYSSIAARPTIAAVGDNRVLRRTARKLRVDNTAAKFRSPKHRSRGRDGKSRKLYESLSNSYMLGPSDETSTTNQLSGLVTEQKAMQNYRTVGSWVSDLDNTLDDLRDSVNRRVADLATGLQRRNMLLGHYNYMNMGVPGAGQSQPGMMNGMSSSLPMSSY